MKSMESKESMNSTDSMESTESELLNSPNLLVASFFDSNNLVSYTINSFNSIYYTLEEMFKNLKLELSVQNEGREEMRIGFTFFNLRFISPVNFQDYPEELTRFPKTPLEALNLNQTYSANILSDVKVYLYKEPSYDPTTIFAQNIINIINGKMPMDESIFNPVEKAEIIIHDCAKFSIPIMLGSDHCITTKLSKRQKWNCGLDPIHEGGIFIVNGVEYAYQTTSSYAFNNPIATANDHKEQLCRAEYISQKNIMYGSSYHSIFIIHQSKVKAMNETISSYDLGVAIHAKNLKLINPAPDAYIPIGLLFKYFGAKSDKEIINYIDIDGDTPSLQAFIIECLSKGKLHNDSNYSGAMTRNDAIQEIGKLLINPEELKKIYESSHRFTKYDEATINRLIRFRIKRVVKYLLAECFMVNMQHNPTATCYEIGNVIRKLWLTKQNKNNRTDRDNLENKRVQMIGQQMIGAFNSILSNTFYESGLKTHSDIKSIVLKTLPFYKVSNFFEESNNNVLKLREAIEKFSTNVSINFNKIFLTRDIMEGRKQSRIVPLMIGHVAKVREYAMIRDVVIRETSKDSVVGYDQRKIHPSHFGFICPIQTPDSGNIGKYQQPTWPCYVTVPEDPSILLKWITGLPMVKPVSKSIAGNTFINVNNSTVGIVDNKDVEEFYELAMEWRSKNAIHISVVYAIEEKSVQFFTDYGRMMIPLVDREKWYDYYRSNINDIRSGFIPKWNDLIRDRILLYADPKMVAYNMTLDPNCFTKQSEPNSLMMMPEGIYGAIPVINPLTNTLKSPRQIMLTSHIKHNVSVPCYNFTTGTYKDIKVLHHPYRQIIGSVVDNKMFGGAYPMFSTIAVSFKHATYNQEDGCVMNEGALYRNLFSTSIFRVFENNKVQQRESYMIGNVKANGMENKDYGIIDPEYAVPTSIGLRVNPNTVLIAKAVMQSSIIDKSIVYDKVSSNIKGSDEELTGNKYIITCNSVPSIYKNTLVKMVRVQLCIRPILGNKFATQTCQKGVLCKIFMPHEMDITDDGIIPCLVMNPSSVIKRETYGTVLEPYFADHIADTNGSITINQFGDKTELLDEALKSDLYKTYYNGKDGSKLKDKIMTGMISYATQEMLLEDKIHCRDHGARNILTRDPTRGKRKNGGASIGSMEIDALLASGIMKSLKSEYGRNSSNSIWMFCKLCNSMNAYYDKLSNCFKCTHCGDISTSEVSVNGLCYKPVIFDAILRGAGYDVRYEESKTLRD